MSWNVLGSSFVKKHYLCKLGKVGEGMFTAGMFLTICSLKALRGMLASLPRLQGGTYEEMARFGSFLSSSFPIFAITVAF